MSLEEEVLTQLLEETVLTEPPPSILPEEEEEELGEEEMEELVKHTHDADSAIFSNTLSKLTDDAQSAAPSVDTTAQEILYFLKQFGSLSSSEFMAKDALKDFLLVGAGSKRSRRSASPVNRPASPHKQPPQSNYPPPAHERDDLETVEGRMEPSRRAFPPSQEPPLQQEENDEEQTNLSMDEYSNSLVEEEEEADDFTERPEATIVTSVVESYAPPPRPSTQQQAPQWNRKTTKKLPKKGKLGKGRSSMGGRRPIPAALPAIREDDAISEGAESYSQASSGTSSQSKGAIFYAVSVPQRKKKPSFLGRAFRRNRPASLDEEDDYYNDDETRDYSVEDQETRLSSVVPTSKPVRGHPPAMAHRREKPQQPMQRGYNNENNKTPGARLSSSAVGKSPRRYDDPSFLDVEDEIATLDSGALEETSVTELLSKIDEDLNSLSLLTSSHHLKGDD